MPGLLYQPLTRQEFLQHAAMTLGAAAFIRGAGGATTEPEKSVRLALLSDTHTPADAMNEYRGFQPVQNLERVLPEVLASQPQGVVINGDAARLTGELDDYRRLHTMLSPLAQQAPIYIGLGNHDHRGNFREVFGGLAGQSAVADKQVLVVEHDTVRLIVLDSLLYVNQVAGLLGKKQRTWLEQYLKTAVAQPTVLFVHHTLGDEDGDLLDANRLFELVKPHPFVKAIFYGHSHRYSIEQRDTVQLINLPAIGYNFADSEPVGWLDAVFTTAGVSLTLRAIGGNQAHTGQTTSVRWS